jgi:hypothetical protein
MFTSVKGINEGVGSGSELRDLDEALGVLGNLSFHDSLGSGMLGLLGFGDKLFLDGDNLRLALLNLSISFSSIVLGFLGFLLGLLDNGFSRVLGALVLVSGGDGFLLGCLGLFGLLSSFSTCNSDGTVVLNSRFGEMLLSFLDEFDFLDDFIVNLS